MEHQFQAGKFLMNRNGLVCVEDLTREMENIPQRLRKKVSSHWKTRQLRLEAEGGQQDSIIHTGSEACSHPSRDDLGVRNALTCRELRTRG